MIQFEGNFDEKGRRTPEGVFGIRTVPSVRWKQGLDVAELEELYARSARLERYLLRQQFAAEPLSMTEVAEAGQLALMACETEHTCVCGAPALEGTEICRDDAMRILNSRA